MNKKLPFLLPAILLLLAVIPMIPSTAATRVTVHIFFYYGDGYNGNVKTLATFFHFNPAKAPTCAYNAAGPSTNGKGEYTFSSAPGAKYCITQSNRVTSCQHDMVFITVKSTPLIQTIKVNFGTCYIG